MQYALPEKPPARPRIVPKEIQAACVQSRCFIISAMSDRRTQSHFAVRGDFINHLSPEHALPLVSGSSSLL